MKLSKRVTQQTIILIGFFLLSLALCAGAWATEKPVEGKALGIRVNKPVLKPAIALTTKQLSLDVKTNKQRYTVGDTFSLDVRGNQNFYLWVFAMNEGAARGRMLVPGIVQGRNNYMANRDYKVPATGSYELFMDKPGLEKVIVVASTKWIDVDVTKLTQNNHYYSSSYNNLQTQLKGLRLLPGQSGNVRTENTIIVTELNLPVDAAQLTVPAPVLVPIVAVPGFQSSGDDTVVFVSQNKDTYRLNDKVTVAYGANKAGWVSLFVQYPSGKSEFLKKEHVDGKQIYTLQAEAVRPAGAQHLMAVFSADKKADFPVTNIHYYTDYFSTSNSKALRLLPTPEKRPVYDISRFTIQ